MKTCLFTSVAVALVLAGARVNAASSVPDPKFIPNPVRHWFAAGGGNSDTSPSSLPLVVHFDNTAQDNINNAHLLSKSRSANNETIRFTF